MATDVFIFGCQHSCIKQNILHFFCVPRFFLYPYLFRASRLFSRGSTRFLFVWLCEFGLSPLPDTRARGVPGSANWLHGRLNGRVVQGARLKFESLRRRGFEPHFNHFFPHFYATGAATFSVSPLLPPVASRAPLVERAAVNR